MLQSCQACTKALDDNNNTKYSIFATSGLTSYTQKFPVIIAPSASGGTIPNAPFRASIFETANWAKEGLDRITLNIDEPYDVIFTDMQMEMMYETEAGEWLIQRVKELSKYYACKIVIISGMYNIQTIADKYNVDCISKNILIHNKLLLKFLFEKLMPFLTKI